jgi:hypothetical protein
MYVTEAIEGLWTVEFGSSTGLFFGGVVVFRGGKLLGGDATHYYAGEYTLTGNTLSATLKVSPFIAGAQSMFNTVGRDFTLLLSGSLTIEASLDDAGIQYQSVQIRVKSKKKLKEKYLDPTKKYEKLDDITDLAGLRVITYYEDEVDRVAEVIKKEFLLTGRIRSTREKLNRTDSATLRSITYVHT